MATPLPAPHGSYAVGRRTLFLVDSSRREPSTPAGDDRREITINIWYPIDRRAVGTAPYMPEVEKYRRVLSDATVDTWERTLSPVSIDARPAPDSFPILLFSHGWQGRSASYSMWLTEVASHGFVVVGVDHPYMGIVATRAPSAALPDDGAFPNQKYADLFYADDLAFVREALARLNTSDPVLRGAFRLSQLFAAGHSSGHAAASAFAAVHGGVRGLISFDAGVSIHARERGLAVPILLVRAEDPTYTDIFVRRPATNSHGTIYDSAFVRRLSAPLLDLHILQTGHGAVLDNLGATGSNPDADAVHALIGHYTIAFLESVLAGAPKVTVRPEDSARVKLQLVSLRDKRMN